MKCIAIVGGARFKGNSFEIANHILENLPNDIFTKKKIIELAGTSIEPCQNCNYECLRKEEKCPQNDDVFDIWNDIYSSNFVLFVTPTYGGTPPALWIALFERIHGVIRELKLNKNQLIASIVIANDGGPKGANAGEFTPDIMRGLLKVWKADEKHFLRIKPLDHKKSSIKLGLIEEESIKNNVNSLANKVIEWGIRQKTELER